MQEHVQHSLELIRGVASRYRRPVVACSFGKDSLVMLHLARQVLPDVPVIFHRLPWGAAKYAYAQRVIEQWELTVHDYPPAEVAVQERGGVLEIVNYYDIAGGRLNYLPYNIDERADGVCGLDLYQRPTARAAYPWDLCLVGNKDGDPDKYLGQLRVHADIDVQLHGTSLLFPIRAWSDAQVWDYIERHELPVHHERYTRTGEGWRERADVAANPDWVAACTRCMRTGAGPVVRCPKLGADVPVVADQLRRAPRLQLSYATTTEG